MGFQKINDTGEMFTIIHFFAGPEKTFFHVQLADSVDDNLKSTPEDSDAFNS